MIRDVRRMIEEARASVAAAVNTRLTMLYWRIGRRINREILKEGRAQYGKAIVSALSRQLLVEYGRGFSAKNLRHMIRFAEVFADETIVSTLWRQLSWSHFKEIIYQKDALQRDFYVELCRVERWSVRTLRQKIDSMLYERTDLLAAIQSEFVSVTDFEREFPSPCFAEHLEYIPDFVAETNDTVFMLEPKASNQMEDPIVLAKKEAAMKWCVNASAHAQNHGGKPWRYVLIPHNEIATNISLDALTARFGA